MWSHVMPRCNFRFCVHNFRRMESRLVGLLEEAVLDASGTPGGAREALVLAAPWPLGAVAWTGLHIPPVRGFPSIEETLSAQGGARGEVAI